MNQSIPQSHPLHRLFRGLTESTFHSELGICDVRLVDYVSNLLARFVPSSEVWRIRNSAGARVTQVAAMVAEAEASLSEDRRRECHQHVGDFTLFWTGVYPEALTRIQAPCSADGLLDLKEQGKRSYFLASTLTQDEAEVFRRLSIQFDLCAFGLSRVRKEWESFDGKDSCGMIVA
jgi:hypothetical protein